MPNKLFQLVTARMGLHRTALSGRRLLLALAFRGETDEALDFEHFNGC